MSFQTSSAWELFKKEPDSYGIDLSKGRAWANIMFKASSSSWGNNDLPTLQPS